MSVSTKTELINDPAVRQEIDRYKWVESEKLGSDIGFDRAAEEWFTRCSKDWLKTRAVPEKKILRKAKKI
jgi:hypothetical protein